MVCCFVVVSILGRGNALARPSEPGKLTAWQAMERMGRGINLGNVYDWSSGNDPSFEASRKMIDLFEARGFQNVRVPVTWGDRFNRSSEKTLIVTQVVNYALDKGLYVVLNTHHERWLKDSYNNTAYYNDRFAALWIGIATHFANASDRLIFEILNEPDGAMGGWGPEQANSFEPGPQALTRAANAVGYWAVRNVSKDRLILVMPNGMGNQALIKHVYPNRSFLPGEGTDPYLGVSVHTYDPWQFCGETGRNSYFDSVPAMQNYMRGVYNGLADWFYEARIPMHIGEYGLGRVALYTKERDTDMARTYYKYVTNTFALNGWPSTVWDDQGWFAITNNFTYFGGLAEAILLTY
jgi:endoglucanase